MCIGLFDCMNGLLLLIEEQFPLAGNQLEFAHAALIVKVPVEELHGSLLGCAGV